MYVRSPEGLLVWEEHHHRTATADPEPRGSRETASCLVVRVEGLVRGVLAHVGVEVVAHAELGVLADIEAENLVEGGGLRLAEKSELPSGKASQKMTTKQEQPYLTTSPLRLPTARSPGQARGVVTREAAQSPVGCKYEPNMKPPPARRLNGKQNLHATRRICSPADRNTASRLRGKARGPILGPPKTLGRIAATFTQRSAHTRNLHEKRLCMVAPVDRHTALHRRLPGNAESGDAWDCGAYHFCVYSGRGEWRFVYSDILFLV